MIGKQALFMLISLVLVMIMNVSTVPIKKDGEKLAATTSFPDVVTDNLLFFDGTEELNNGDISDNKYLLYSKDSTPFIPVADEPLEFDG